MTEHDVIIIGSGVAGLSAAIYAGRQDNSPLVIKGDEPGGQLTLTTEVANYPGFPEGLSGPELIGQMEEQAEQFGTETVNGIVESVSDDAGLFHITMKNGDSYIAPAVIVASGASARTLGIPGEDDLMGYGVSTCATCDGAFFRDEKMAVVGGGDAAAEEASFLTKFADKVYLIHRRDELRAEQYWKDTVQEHVNNGEIEILWNTEVTEVTGSPSEGVDTVKTVNHPDGRPTEKDDAEAGEIDVEAVFLAIGHTPNTDFLEGTGVELDDAGYMQVQNGSGGGQTKTAVAGLFGAGDVFDSHYQQAATAAGSGVKAALDVDAYLSEVGE